MTCFPSNATLCLSTAWGLSKLKEVKRSLVVDGYLSSVERKNGDFQLTNLYTIETEHLSVYVNLKGKGGLEEGAANATGGRSETRPGGGANATTEVLTSKVLSFNVVDTAEQKLKKWTDEIRLNPKTKNAYTRGRGLKIENFESDFEKWLAEAEASPEQYEDRAAVVKHFLNHASNADQKNHAKPTQTQYARPASNKMRTVEVETTGYSADQLF